MASTVRNVTLDTADADLVISYVEGQGYTKAVQAACNLQLFDLLAGGATSAEELAAPRDWDAVTLDCLLSLCTSMKLVKKLKRQDGAYAYEVLGPGRLLMKNEEGPATLWGFAQWGGMSSTWKDFEKAIKKEKEDKPGHGHSHGDSEHSEGHEHSKEHSHDNGAEKDTKPWDQVPLHMFRMMDGMGQSYVGELMKQMDLQQYKTVVDIGAGSGIAGLTLLKQYPHMTVTLQDGEGPLKVAKDHFVPKELVDRVSYLPGDVMEIDLPRADLFVASQVLHHLGSDNSNKLLKNIYNSLNPGGALILVEAVLNEDKAGPLFKVMWIAPDSDRFVSSRTASGFIHLLEGHGFQQVQVIQTQEMSMDDVIFAKKA